MANDEKQLQAGKDAIEEIFKATIAAWWHTKWRAWNRYK